MVWVERTFVPIFVFLCKILHSIYYKHFVWICYFCCFGTRVVRKTFAILLKARPFPSIQILSGLNILSCPFLNSYVWIYLSQVQVNLCQKLFFLQNMWRTCCVQKLFWMSETISVHNMFSPGLSLEFSCIELVIQWTICRHIVG